MKELLSFTRVLNEQAFFHLSCACGSDAFHILGYPIATIPGVITSPVSVQCETCERIAPLFDPREHGYDAEHGYRPSLPGGEPQRFICPQCSGVTFAAYLTFNYQLYEPDITPQQWTHIQDFFDGFAVDARCKHCGTLSSAAEHECA